MKPIALQDTTTREKAQNGKGWSEDGTSYTLDAAATQGVAIPLDLRNAGRDPEKHDEINRQGVGVGAPGEPSHTISTACVHGVAYGLDEEQNAGRELFGTLKARQAGGGFEGAVAFQPGNLTRRAGSEPSTQTFPTSGATMQGDQQPHVVAVDTYNQAIQDTAVPIRSTASDICHTGGVIDRRQAMAVRRLTPTECERLQGFPDNHTRIPWRGKPAEQCPDGPRYKALGNSMAVPCMAWIGSRIAAQESQPLRYLSVCSGIEAASMAWEPLGWQPAAFAEVEKFPSAVLAHHWPQVPNLGDMTQFREWREHFADTDLLVGGTPCQAFSVAGLRRSLEDERGNLSLTYIHLLDEIDNARIAAGRPSAICVWENVPGVLSTKDNAFGCFLGALAGSGCALQPPGGRWANAGYVRGPKRQVCWRVLDAQYFGVAQRRRRVFVVANAGDRIAPSEVLFEQPCLRWNPPTRREAGERVAADAAGGAGDGRRGGA